MFLCSYWGIHPLSLCCCAWLVFLGFSVLSRTLLRYSPGFYSFPDTRPDHSSILALTLFRYSPRFYQILGTRSDPSPVLPWIPPFFSTLSDPFSIFTRILPLSWYSPWPFFGTHLDFTLFQYSPDPSPILTQILPHFDTRSNTISSPASCLDFLRFFGTLPDLIHFPSVYSGLVSESPDLFQHHVWFPLVFSSIMSRFLYLSPTLCLDPLVHSVSMTHFP